MKIRIFYLSVIVIGLLISFGLSRNLYSIYQNSTMVTTARDKLTRLKTENEKLQQENTQASAPGFIEQQARQALGLVKPGEVVVVLPSNLATATVSSTATSSTAAPPRSIWQQWVGLFFGG